MAGAKHSESYHMLAEAVRKKTAEIPLLTDEIEDALKQEKHQYRYIKQQKEKVDF